ncbi:MAG: hypothetical protein JWQ98_1118 [Chlorobi bacterium]|nr:hypothetical protein [Chlorobiota bacterium]
MTRPPHRIRRERWAIRTGTVPEALLLRKRLRDEWWEGLRSAMERAFDEIDIGDRLVHIPLIELDLQVSPEADLGALLPELIYRQLSRRLHEAMENLHRNGTLASVERTVSEERVAMLFHYLRTGQLPWTAAGDTGADLRKTAVDEMSRMVALLGDGDQSAAAIVRLLQLLTEVDVRQLIGMLADAVPALRAIADVAAWIMMPDNLPAGMSGGRDQRVGALLSKLGTGRRHVRLRLASALLAAGLRRNISPSVALDTVARDILTVDEVSALRSLLMVLEMEEMTFLTDADSLKNVPSRDAGNKDIPADISSADIAREAMGASGDDSPERSVATDRPTAGATDDAGGSAIIPPVSAGERNDIADAMPEAGSSLRRDDIDPLKANRIPVHDIHPPASGLIEQGSNNGSEATSGHASGSALHTAARDGSRDDGFSGLSPSTAAGGELPVSVHNAGLVLLHPFIVRLFGHCGIMDEASRAIPPANAARGTALLYYLATGSEEALEFELDICRLLAGARPEEPVLVAGGMLRHEDMEEADALLAAAIGHWSALKNTSIAGLRGSFLRRPGLLRRDHHGWRLQVEHASYDMLLNTLPWGLGIVALPWMPKPIHVEWNG